MKELDFETVVENVEKIAKDLTDYYQKAIDNEAASKRMTVYNAADLGLNVVGCFLFFIIRNMVVMTDGDRDEIHEFIFNQVRELFSLCDLRQQSAIDDFRQPVIEQKYLM